LSLLIIDIIFLGDVWLSWDLGVCSS